MRNPKKETARRTKPVGAEVFDADEERQWQFSQCFAFSLVDVDKPCDRTPRLESVSVPLGTPDWITEELIRDTIETWQHYSEKQLDSDAATALLLNVAELLDVPTGQGSDVN